MPVWAMASCEVTHSKCSPCSFRRNVVLQQLRLLPHASFTSFNSSRVWKRFWYKPWIVYPVLNSKNLVLQYWRRVLRPHASLHWLITIEQSVRQLRNTNKFRLNSPQGNAHSQLDCSFFVALSHSYIYSFLRIISAWNKNVSLNAATFMIR